MSCDSGVALPIDGTLRDEHWSYHVAPCGYVTRYAHGRWSTYGRAQYARHMQQAHPQRWAQIEKIRRMSED